MNKRLEINQKLKEDEKENNYPCDFISDPLNCSQYRNGYLYLSMVSFISWEGNIHQPYRKSQLLWLGKTKSRENDKLSRKIDILGDVNKVGNKVKIIF